MSTILVTGANGFLGRHVCRAASARGDEVIGIGHGDWAGDGWRRWGLSAWHELDVTYASLVAHVGRPDMIVHCAGSSSVGFSLQNPAQDFDRTVVTTRDVIEFVRTSAPEAALVYPSSAAVYGAANRLPISEESAMAPISPYGVHKSIAEDLCRSYSRTYGVRSSIVRIFSAYGPGLRKQLLWDACRKAVGGDRTFGGTGSETRDWVHVEDVARLLLMAGEHAEVGSALVNGASGTEVSVEAVLMTLWDAIQADGRPEFSGTTRVGDPERVVGDPSRAAGWGWVPQRQWADGVREYADWYRRANL